MRCDGFESEWMDATHDKICHCEHSKEVLYVSKVHLGSVPRHLTVLLINQSQKRNIQVSEHDAGNRPVASVSAIVVIMNEMCIVHQSSRLPALSCYELKL